MADFQISSREGPEISIAEKAGPRIKITACIIVIMMFRRGFLELLRP